jgi:DNA-binding NarL/FixJ family response regulator
MDGKIEVLVVDDLPPVTRRLKRILLDSGGAAEVRIAASGREAVAAAAAARPDVVLMDVAMETRTAGIEATRTILAADPTIRIIMLTVYEDEDNIADAFQAGVVNYVLKDASPAHIVKTVRDAHAGASAINPKISRVLIDQFKRIRQNEERLRFYIDTIAPLSSTEVAILKLLCAGKTRAEICEERGVEESTVKTQIRSLLTKVKQDKTKNAVRIIKDLNVMELLK